MGERGATSGTLVLAEDVPPDARRPGFFAWGCLAIALVALAARLVFALRVPHQPAADPSYYRHLAANLVRGAGYAFGWPGDPTPFANHPPEPYANFPPLFPLVLAGLDLLGLESIRQHAAALAVVATAGVVVMGLVGRRLGGAAVGLVAAAIAAIHPLWIQPPGIRMGESVFLVVVPVVLLCAVRFLDRPSARRAMALGVAIGVATLNRSESVALVVVLAVPLILLATAAWRPRLAYGAVLLGACCLVVGPWVVRNAVRFGGLTLSTQQGAAFSATNCAATYDGPGIGGFDQDCFRRSIVAAYMGPLRDEPAPRNPVRLSRELQRTGLAYMTGHARQLPRVVVARILRGWGVFAVADQLDYDVRLEGRDRGLQQAGTWCHWVLLGLAAVGAATLPSWWWRRWSVVLAGPLLFTLTSAAIYGSVRLRTIAEPSLALLAGVAVVAAAGRLPASVDGRRPEDGGGAAAADERAAARAGGAGRRARRADALSVP